METRENVILPLRFLHTCRANMRRVKLGDSSGAELTGSQLLTRALLLRRLLRREVLAADEPHVGLLLPPSAAGAVVNVALALDRRVAVNLNYSETVEVVGRSVERAGVRHVLTSRRVLENPELKKFADLPAEIVCLEDLVARIRLTDKLLSAAAAWLMPLGMLARRLGLDRVAPDDVLTIIFTSGATGQPKGVVLSHRNVGSNLDAFASVLHLQPSDVLIGILPFFHSFGYTTTMWTPLTLEPKAVFHHSPREPKPIGRLCRRHGATLLIATPTFLRWYLRGCQPEDFARLDLVITGAERLPPELADQFESRFGVRPVEGYGATELSPVVSTNIPPSRADGAESHAGRREGTVGRPLPGIAAKVVDLDTGEDLGVDRPGMLLISGPNVMKGYLGQPEQTAEVVRDGWYRTGDVAMIDSDGFIKITGRQSRFAKIGGEMVPMILVEEEIGRLVEADEESARLAVTAVADPKKGERLIVLHTGLPLAPAEICRRLAEAGLKPMAIPSPDSFHKIDEIPLLGSGKLDLKRLRSIAAELAR